MRKYWLSLALILLAIFGIAVAFTLKTQGSAEPSLNGNVPPSDSAGSPPVSLPKPQYWVLSENPSASKEGLTLSVLLVAINPAQTLMIYSLAAPEQIEAKALTINLVETGKSSNALKENDILGQFGNVQVGVLGFDPPKSKGAELHLNVDSSQTGFLEMMVTKNTNAPNNELPLDASDTSINARTGAIEEGDYVISFNGFGLYTGDLQAEQANAKPKTQEQDLMDAQDEVISSDPQPTPAIEEPQAITQELAAGKVVWDHATFRIQKMSTKEVKFLYIVILNDGQVKAKVID